MKYILILAALLSSGCVTKSTMLKNMNDQKNALEKRHRDEMKFNLVVQESLIVEQCNTALDQVQRSWEVGYCLHDRKMEDALAKAQGRKPQYLAPCRNILKDIKEQSAKSENKPVTPAREYDSGKR